MIFWILLIPVIIINEIFSSKSFKLIVEITGDIKEEKKLGDDIACLGWIIGIFLYLYISKNRLKLKNKSIKIRRKEMATKVKEELIKYSSTYNYSKIISKDLVSKMYDKYNAILGHDLLHVYLIQDRLLCAFELIEDVRKNNVWTDDLQKIINDVFLEIDILMDKILVIIEYEKAKANKNLEETSIENLSTLKIEISNINDDFEKIIKNHLHLDQIVL